MSLIDGLCSLPPVSGHNYPIILNKELFPQPLGPDIIRFIPGLILNVILGTRISPVGEIIGTSTNSKF